MKSKYALCVFIILCFLLAGCDTTHNIVSAKGESFQISLPKEVEEQEVNENSLGETCEFGYNGINLKIIKNEGSIADCKEMINSFVSGYAVYGETTKPNLVNHKEDGMDECAAGNFVYKEPDKQTGFFCKAIKKGNILYLGVLEVPSDAKKDDIKEMQTSLQTMHFMED